MDLPWVEKYRPKTTSEVVGIRTNLDKMLEYVKKKLANPDEELKPLLLEGPPGVGKTTCVYAVANELGLDVLEMNASDERSSERIREVLSTAFRSQSLRGFFSPRASKPSRGKLILIDEVDGISGQADRGGLQTLLKLLPESRFPVFLTANEYVPRLRPLYDAVIKLPFKRIPPKTVANLLRRIAEGEGVEVGDVVLLAIARQAAGDIRSAINDFQSLVKNERGNAGIAELKEVRVMRDSVHSIFSSLMKLFQSGTMSEARDAVDAADVDLDRFVLWLNQNLAQFYKTPEELAAAYDALAMSDRFTAAIWETQDWGLLPYAVEIAAGGVALARKGTPPPSSYVKTKSPARRLDDATRGEREILEKLSKRLSLPTSAVRRYVPILKSISRQDRSYLDQAVAKLDLSATGQRGLKTWGR
ncbi:MAG: replication factor C large subunit [Promethearchaeota archaeon]